MQEIAEIAESHDLLLISDEAYERFVYDDNVIQRRLQESDLISAVVPQGATFFYLNFSRLGVGEDEFCGHLLARYGVPTVPGRSFAGGEMQRGGYLRLPFGGSAGTIERAVRGLHAAADDALRGELLPAPAVS